MVGAILFSKLQINKPCFSFKREEKSETISHVDTERSLHTNVEDYPLH